MLRILALCALGAVSLPGSGFPGEHLAAVRVRKIRVDPPTPGIRIEIEPGATLNEQEAQHIAAGIVQQLQSSGYPDAKAGARLIPAGPGKADLAIHIERGQAVDVANVTVSGDLGMKPSEVRQALRATRAKTMFPGIPGVWKGWHLLPGYNPEIVQSDRDNLQSLYYRRGFFDADVRVASVDISGGKARVTYAVQEGPQYDARAGDAVCRELFDERRTAERTGALEFSARLGIRGGAPSAGMTAEVTAGPAYRTGRIEFRGNHRFRDASLRRLLLLEEGMPLDQTLLRESLGRINRTGWFEPLTERNVVVNTPPGSDRADVFIRLKEKKTRHWSLSGPVGPMSLEGSLRFAIGSRLPPWGQGLLELSTYTLSLNLMLFPKPIGALVPFLPNRRFIQIVTIDRPLLSGQPLVSGFSIAPRLGWQGMLAGYGASQTRSVLSRLLETGRDLTPGLLVTVSHDGREGTLRCEPPRARFDRVRAIAGSAVNVLFSFSPL